MQSSLALRRKYLLRGLAVFSAACPLLPFLATSVSQNCLPHFLSCCFSVVRHLLPAWTLTSSEFSVAPCPSLIPLLPLSTLAPCHDKSSAIRVPSAFNLSCTAYTPRPHPRMALTLSPSSFPTTSFVSTLLTKPAQRCIRLKTSCALSHRRLSALIEHNRRRFLHVKGGRGGGTWG